MEGDTTKDMREEMPDSAIEYFDFLNDELQATLGASFFFMHHPAPDDMSREQLEVMAADIRAIGWNAEVAPISPEESDSPLGIRIGSQG